MKAENILTSRLPLYARTSDFIINTEGKIPEEIVLRIDNEINNTFKD
jgi:shikimate kinase